MSQDFYIEEEVMFRVDDKEENETDAEQFYETNQSTNKHEDETGSFMTGEETSKTEDSHPTTHDDETGSFVAGNDDTNNEGINDEGINDEGINDEGINDESINADNDTKENDKEEIIIASVYLPTISIIDDEYKNSFNWKPYNSLKLNYEKTGKIVVAGLSVCVAGYMLTKLLRH
jgi:hypothetical protein